MTSASTRTGDVPARLIAAATRLFAERGLDAVSLREITREAGVKHVTAVQYHFGGRAELISAVLAPHAAQIDTRREAMLDNYEADPTAADVRSVAAILVRPLASELKTVDGCDYLRIYPHIVQRAEVKFPDNGTSIWRWRRHAEQFLPTGVASLHPRYSALTFTTVELARRAADPRRTDDELFTSRLIDIVAAIIQTPLSEETTRLLATHRKHGETAGRADYGGSSPP
jgi:AcrR family transcriptional regulator